MTYKEEFIKFMVRSGVLMFGDFTAKSGRRTPYFINTGNYKTGEQIQRLGTFYADCIKANKLESADILFGPAYKGIPLVISTSIALNMKYGIDKKYSFNRKEVKDHGEGGTFVGSKLSDGQKIIIIEDVITAGTAIREVVPLLKSVADVEILGLIISVDRMEKGQGNFTATQEIKNEFGIETYPIVTTREIIDTLYATPIDGKIYVDDKVKEKMEEYLYKYEG
ncbi:MAG: orotate phosphoribosyltransferase [Filifactoraceae bacterium]